MVVRVTDKELLKKAGGIIQGMSGSPIIQNGKIIGAVTHVFVNDSTRGYGIFIDNMLDAIQKGIILDSTKKRLADLEERQKELQIEITQEQIKRPALSREQILFGLTKFRKSDLTTQEGKQRLIDSFVNRIYLFDDYAIITCNYKDGEEKITFEDIENSEFGELIKGQKNKPERESSDLFVAGEPFDNNPNQNLLLISLFRLSHRDYNQIFKSPIAH